MMANYHEQEAVVHIWWQKKEKQTTSGSRNCYDKAALTFTHLWGRFPDIQLHTSTLLWWYLNIGRISDQWDKPFVCPVWLFSLCYFRCNMPDQLKSCQHDPTGANGAGRTSNTTAADAHRQPNAGQWPSLVCQGPVRTWTIFSSTCVSQVASALLLDAMLSS